MKYDDASWHSGGDFPADLSEDAGATHTGMFVAWAMLSGLSGPIHIDDFPEDIPKLQSRSITPGKFFLASCDGKFTDEDLSDEGNAFAQAYFDLSKGKFVADYEQAVARDLPSIYHVPDTWETYERLRPIFDSRLSEWRNRA
jgi:hypothetical protein